MPEKVRKIMRERWMTISILVAGIDQMTKYTSTERLSIVDPIHVFPGLDFTLRHNTGAGWSLLAGGSGWQRWFLIGLAMVVSVIIYIWLGKLSAKEKMEACALSLILGGAFGNLLDRVNHGYVIDFILFYYNEKWQWPAFNIADTAICIGVALLIPILLKKEN